MKNDPSIFIEYITESIATVEEYTRDVKRENFLANQQLQDAVIRRLEIIGEAVRNIPDELRACLESSYSAAIVLRQLADLAANHSPLVTPT